MEKYAEKQDSLLRRIARNVENLKKLGAGNITEGVLQTRLELLEKNWSQYCNNHDEMMNRFYLTEDQCDPYFKEDAIGTTEEVYSTQKAYLLDLLKKITPPNSSATPAVHVIEQLRQPLPEIGLPKFSVEFRHWNNFRDLFKSMVINNTSLSAVQKLYYLKMSLSEEPASLIENIPISEADLPRAWQAITDRYENKRLLVNSQVSELMALAPMDQRTAKELRRVLNRTLNTIEALKILERPVQHWDDILIYLTVERLDPKTREQWNDSLGASTDVPTFARLRTFLEGKLGSLSTKEDQHTKQTTSRPGTSNHGGQERKTRTAASSSSSIYKAPKTHVATNANRTPKCADCSQEHFLLFCPDYKRMNPRKRKDLVKEKRLCYNCLAPHSVQICKSTKRCQQCTGKHHTSIHLSEERISSSSELLQGDTSSAEQRGDAESSSSESSVQKTSHNANLSRMSRSVLLATALIEVETISGERLEVRALIDPGSEVSLIEENLAQLLRLPRDKGRIPIFGVAQSKNYTRGPTGSLVDEKQKGPAVSLQCSADGNLDDILQRFWSQEELSTSQQGMSTEEIACEEHYARTHARDSNGRYVLRLPFYRPISELGDSLSTAQILANNLEKRFQKSPTLENSYREFMTEYESLGQMTPLTDEEPTQTPAYYLPHHGVVRESSTTTKRGVKNNSQKTSTGVSLNDLLHKGPNLLPDMFELLLRWRRHSVVFMADIEKMYRQIWIHVDDCDFQRILWRKEREAPLQVYRLLTVTYGMSCAPYLAIKTLRQLSEDEAHNYPLASSCIRSDVYMDDVISGTDDLPSAELLQRQLISMLQAGGFKLKKWASNKTELLTNLSADYLASPNELSCHLEQTFSLLGLKWNPASDCFLITVKLKKREKLLTKRIVFSEIASLYDPLGLLAPVIITAKIFLQSLWLLKIEWDEPLPETYRNSWEIFYRNLDCLSSLQIPRWISIRNDNALYELHGFGDASEKAYVAVLYLRVISKHAPPLTSLLTSKTRVAPLKQISLPRLELCAATLLVRLTKIVRRTLALTDSPVYLWTDSTIVLCWLQKQPRNWTTFVANRVSEIQTSLPKANWLHVKTTENPADCASRGLASDLLTNNKLWWDGPTFLRIPEYDLNTHRVTEYTTEREARHNKTVLNVSQESEKNGWDLLSRYSSLHRLVRITAWCLRFIRRLRKENLLCDRNDLLATSELDRARLTLLRVVQNQFFSEEIKLLSHSKSIGRGSLARLTPFLDSDELLRVGGRLENASIAFDAKHPIILPQKSQITTLLIRQYHLDLLHGGTQLTLSSLREKYWIIRGRSAVKSVIYACLPCLRWRKANPHQLMGDLPSTRVTPSRPFLDSGVDYAGPYNIKIAKGRGYRSYKSYVVVFVCLATRAIHLELVSDYTSAAFLAAYRRFISRRGVCRSLRSDQGTNFVGADKELRLLFSAASEEFGKTTSKLAELGTQWQFNPPAAPHFGGIWEAAVKAMKRHL